METTVGLRKELSLIVAEAAGYRVTLAGVASYLTDDSLTDAEKIEKALAHATKELTAWPK